MNLNKLHWRLLIGQPIVPEEIFSIRETVLQMTLFLP